MYVAHSTHSDFVVYTLATHRRKSAPALTFPSRSCRLCRYADFNHGIREENPLTTTESGAPNTPKEEWFGHPKGLFYLFFAEMWERFCFYGMRNILVLYMTYYFLFSDEFAQGGVYAAYMSLVYCMAIFGGYMADKYLGYRRSIIFGGIVMAAGMVMLLFNRELLGYIGIPLTKGLEQFFFFAGMATIIIGNGYFKPNISAIVGRLYERGDPRRDAGFTIFYMGINVGAFGGGLICGYLGQQISWPLGFGV
ncbi:MAG: MFS transporter, partial [Candidatus Krumholzibacteria bacterium]|nr:MFS transporter [Candidatus Krumholzibacteria bacterium]